mgnify:CR=1 FL=1
MASQDIPVKRGRGRPRLNKPIPDTTPDTSTAFNAVGNIVNVIEERQQEDLEDQAKTLPAEQPVRVITEPIPAPAPVVPVFQPKQALSIPVLPVTPLTNPHYSKNTAFVVQKHEREIDQLLSTLFGKADYDFFLIGESPFDAYVEGKRRKFKILQVQHNNRRHAVWLDVSNLSLRYY